jgi:hypothetical protein
MGVGLFGWHRDRRAGMPRRPVQDVDLDSLLGLVAESLGYVCEFSGDGASLRLHRANEPSGADDADGTDGATDVITVRLAGLRREAGRRSREDWPVLVSGHLTHVIATAGEPVDASDLAQAGPLLRVRLRPADDPAWDPAGDPADGRAGHGRVVGRHLSADLVEVLTIGHAAGARAVRPEEAACWPVPSAQALDMAVRNSRRDERLAVSAVDLGGVRAWRLSGRGEAAAAHLRWLEEYVPVPADGVVVALPGTGTLIVHPVDGVGVVRAIERMRVAAQREHDAHAEARRLSPQVYWWHRRRLRLIRADLVAQAGQTRLVVAPPPEFARVLADLARNR